MNVNGIYNFGCSGSEFATFLPHFLSLPHFLPLRIMQSSISADMHFKM